MNESERVQSPPRPEEERELAQVDKMAMDRMRALHRKVCEDAANDLKLLGLTPTPLMVHAYQWRVGTWKPLTHVDADVAEAIGRELEDETSQDARSFLPSLVFAGRVSTSTKVPALEERQHKSWSACVRELVRARMVHASTLGERGNYLLLKRSPTLPSRDVFFGCAFWLGQDRIKEAGAIDRAHNDVVLGVSAAEASTWHLRTLSHFLEEVDLVLNPRESYLSLRSPPKQLGVWKEVGFRLRRCLPSSMSGHAKSKTVAAAMITYAGFAGSVDQMAKDTVEKWWLQGESRGEIPA
ncbi:MAG TPA: hypothetical protein VGR43_07040 [Dehalococcoidia bacterium]|nr:hypothetical protein [Dehalococcoidia bacterium]